MSTERIAEERHLPWSTQQVQPDIDIENVRNIEDVRKKVTELEQKARTMIRERPVVAVMAALGLGYVVARLVSRAGR